MLRAKKSMTLYSLAKNLSPFGVGVIAATNEAIAIMAVTQAKILRYNIYFLLFYEFAAIYALPVVTASLQVVFLLEDEPTTLGVSLVPS